MMMMMMMMMMSLMLFLLLFPGDTILKALSESEKDDWVKALKVCDDDNDNDDDVYLGGL